MSIKLNDFILDFFLSAGGSESDSLLKDVDINSVSGLLKSYLRQLPEALFTDRLYPHFLQVSSLYKNSDHFLTSHLSFFC